MLAMVNAPICPSAVTAVFAPTLTIESIRWNPKLPFGFIHVAPRTVSAFAVRAMTVPEIWSSDGLCKLVPARMLVAVNVGVVPVCNEPYAPIIVSAGNAARAVKPAVPT